MFGKPETSLGGGFETVEFLMFIKIKTVGIKNRFTNDFEPLKEVSMSPESLKEVSMTRVIERRKRLCMLVSSLLFT